jgi:hypothetical protein
MSTLSEVTVYGVEGLGSIPGMILRIYLVTFKSRTLWNLKSSVFWDITLCSPLKVNRRFGGIYRLNSKSAPSKKLAWNSYQACRIWPACLLVFAELISSTLKMEAICSSEMSVETRRTTRRHIPGTLAATVIVTWFFLVSCLAYFSTLRIDAMFLRNVGYFHRNTDRTLHNRSYQNLTSYVLWSLFIIL